MSSFGQYSYQLLLKPFTIAYLCQRVILHVYWPQFLFLILNPY
jgi:hypothetical protein